MKHIYLLFFIIVLKAETQAAINCDSFTVSSVAVTNDLCFADSTGSIVVFATGGALPYQYALDTGAYQSSDTFIHVLAGSYVVHIQDSTGCIYTDSTAVVISAPAPLSVNVTTTNPVGGNNGSATAHVSGGTTPYSCYNWNSGPTGPNITGLSAGNYCVTVCDVHNCSASACDSVTLPSCTGFKITRVTTKDISCFGAADGTIIITASGGFPPYQYSDYPAVFQSSDTLTGLITGTYTVYVKDSVGCIIADSNGIYITQPNVLKVSVSTTAVSTVGGSNGTATTMVSGGNAPYFYSWQPGGFIAGHISNLVAGMYCVTVTDRNGCTATRCDSVAPPSCSGFKIDSVDVQESLCGGVGASIALYASGGKRPYLYTLDSASPQTSNHFTFVGPGNHYITATDSIHCFTAWRNNPIIVSIHNLPNDTIMAMGDTLTSQAFYTYHWVLNGTQLPGDTNQTCIARQTGDYYVMVTDSPGCEAASNILHITVLGLEQWGNDGLLLSVFPNPFTDELNVRLKGNRSSPVDVNLYDVSGRKMSGGYFDGNNFVLRTAISAAGVYFLAVRVNDTIFYRQLIRQ